MNGDIAVTEAEIDSLHRRMQKDAGDYGYFLNPDVEFTRDLVKGILVNEKRYGYGNCPCRLASGDKDDDLDMVCPCDYRDPDIAEYGSCY